VDNPLYGPRGAAYIYGPQKGATERMVAELDKGLIHYANMVKRDLKIDIADEKGAGAAGGLGGGLMAFLKGTLTPGVDIVIEKTNLRKIIENADLVITGEGKIDSQTINGKTPIGVAKLAKEYDIPVIAIGGYIADDGDIVHQKGIDAIFSIVNYPISMEKALDKNTSSFFIERTIGEIFRLIKLIEKIKE